MITKNSKGVAVPPAPEIHNNTPFTLEQIRTFQMYGSFNNAWRNRLVEVYQHPTDAQRIVSVGVSYNGSEYWLCDEPYADYASRIKHNNWSTYY